MPAESAPEWDRNTQWIGPAAVQRDQQAASHWIEGAAFTKAGAEFWSGLSETATCADPARFTILDLLQQTRAIGGLSAFGTAERDYLSTGAQKIAEWLGRQLSREVELETPVGRIEHSTDGAKVVTDRGTWTARSVVVAVPLSVLDTITFEPALPAPRRALASHVVRGHVIKTIVVYDRPHWRDAGFSGRVYSPQAPVTVAMDGAAPAAKAGILVALTTGRSAVRLGALPSDERRHAILDHIARCFPSTRDKTPIDYLECDWNKEPWSGGAYASRLGPGGWTTVGSALRDPVGPIHWAGTELATEWRSYMEGAVESGERAAREVLAAHPP